MAEYGVETRDGNLTFDSVRRAFWFKHKLERMAKNKQELLG